MPHSPLFRKFSRILRSHQGQETLPRLNRIFSRRELLVEASTAAAATLFTSTILDSAWASTRPVIGETPVIILGGGVAGLTAAYRLMKAGKPCHIYEGASRIGGRMCTLSHFNSENMFADLGGEFVDADHVELSTLCAELKVPLETYQEGDRTQREIFFVNGKIYSDEDLVPRFRPLAKRIKSDIKKLFGDQILVSPTYDHDYGAAVFDRLSLYDYLYKMTDVDKWVLDIVNAIYLTEYGLDTREQSALNLILLISSDENRAQLMGDSDMSRRIQGGSGALPHALEKAIQGRVPISMEHKLTRIEEKGGNLHLTFLKDATHVEIKTQRVICTLPFSTLRNVENIFKLDLNPVKKHCIGELGYGTNSKLILGFSERTWRNKPVLQNKVSNGSIWSNSSSFHYWEQSRLQKGKAGILCNYTGGEVGLNLQPSALGATLGSLEEVFKGASSSFYGLKKIVNWSKSPFALGSYSCPKVGQYTSINGIQGASELGGRLIFAGEHTSQDYGGYMNGAVQSGNRAAKEAAG